MSAARLASPADRGLAAALAASASALLLAASLHGHLLCAALCLLGAAHAPPEICRGAPTGG